MTGSWHRALKPAPGERVPFAGRALFALVVPASALALGSLKPIILAVVALLAAASAALVWTDAIDRVSRNTKVVVAALALSTAVTALQLVPLPASAVHALAPLNAELWSRAFVPFGEGAPGWHPLSLDPAATQVQLARCLTYLCVFLAAVRIASTPEGVTFIEVLVVASGVAMAFAALAHPALGAERVFGIYRPRDVYSYQVGYYAPLLNVNHLTAYLNVAACVALAFLLRHPRRKTSIIVAVALFLLAGTSVWAGSRGGMGGLVLGVFLTVLAQWLTKKERRRGSTVTVATLVTLGAVVLLAIGMSGSARGELANTQLNKLSVALEGLRLVRLSPVLGVGRGAFESVFPYVQETNIYATSTHPENIVAQWVSEWGVPFAIAIAAMFVWALRPSELLTRVTPAAGAWAAVIATVVHDLVDFHLEVPGVVILVVTCVAVAVVGRRRHAEELESRRSRLAVWSAAAVTAVVALFAGTYEGRTVSAERVAFSQLAIDETMPSPDFKRALREAIARHPAEAFLPLMGAVRAQTVDREKAMPWVASALERNPRLGRAHFVLARILAPYNRAQARLEYRLAWAYDMGLRDVVLAEAVRLVASSDEARELVVDGIDGVTALERLSRELGARLPATASILDDEVLRRDPRAAGPLLRRAQALQSDLEQDETWCADGSCARDAVHAAEAAAEAAPADCTTHLVLAQARLRSGDLKAIDALAQATDGVSERLVCKERAVLLADSLGLHSQATTLAEEIARYGCESSPESADRYFWLGNYESDRGRDARALSFYKRAADVDAAREDVQLRIYTVATRNGLHGDASSAAEWMLRRHPNDPEWTRRRDHAKAQARLNRHAPLLTDPVRELHP